MPDPSWAIMVHGGARSIPAAAAEANRAGCLAAAAAGQAVLERGGSALDAVEAAVRVLESDPTFNAGYGSVLNADGEVETDASIMDGATLAIGAVGAVQGVRHPVSVARLLLPETPTLLVGEGAARFAREHGAELCRPEEMIAPSAREAAGVGADTVGCVALDAGGSLAAGLSTGGLTGKMPGRIGDSALPGCGFYADDQAGAVAWSGDGERISRTLLSSRVIWALGDRGPQAAAGTALQALARVGGEAGAIVLDPRGRFGCAHNSEHFAVALASETTPARAAIHQDELQELTSHD